MKPSPFKTFSANLSGDLIGGASAMLVALPSSIAFGMIVFAPLGNEFTSEAAISGMMSVIILSIVAALFGGTRGLITAPCAPASAVLSLYVVQLVKGGDAPLHQIPLLVALLGLCAGVIQVILGFAGGGRLIKYIPYPVVAGFLSASGVLILKAQLPKWLGLPKSVGIFDIWSPDYRVNFESLLIGAVTLAVLYLGDGKFKKIPTVVAGLAAGLITFAILAILDPSLRTLDNNHLVIGSIKSARMDAFASVYEHWSGLSQVTPTQLTRTALTAVTLAIILSMDTLKTCLIVDSFSHERHDSNRELVGQGLANIAAGGMLGIAGAGTTGPTLINIRSGAKKRLSGVIMGVSALLAFLFLGPLIAWTPVAALSAVLIHSGIRMLDLKSLRLVRNRSTRLDLLVMVSVIIAAVFLDLMTASAVGVGLSMIVFIRDQISTSVIRNVYRGDKVFSKHVRSLRQMALLEAKGSHTLVMELQGHLFFGTTDQMYNRIEPHIRDSTHVLLDMQRVQSIDYTATQMLVQIHSRLRSNGGCLVICGLNLQRNTFEHIRASRPNDFQGMLFFPDLNAGLEHAEESLLVSATNNLDDDHDVLGLHEFEVFQGMPSELLQEFSECIEERELMEGETLFRENDPGEEIFFLRKGVLHINLPLKDRHHMRLVTIGRGGMFGEMAFIDHLPRSTDAVAHRHCHVYVLRRARFDDLCKAHPAMGAWFFERLASVVSSRLRITNAELKVLKEH